LTPIRSPLGKGRVAEPKDGGTGIVSGGVAVGEAVCPDTKTANDSIKAIAATIAKPAFPLVLLWTGYFKIC
jgi:hypothetical protein